MPDTLGSVKQSIRDDVGLSNDGNSDPVRLITQQDILDMFAEEEEGVEVDPVLVETLVQSVDDFVDSSLEFAQQLAQHRGSERIAVQDLKVHLEKNRGMLMPGFGAPVARQLGLQPGERHFNLKEKVRAAKMSQQNGR